MAYCRTKANSKTQVETLENSLAIISALIAAKISSEFGFQLSGEQLLILGGAIKILYSRVRNKFKHAKKVGK